MMGKQGSNAHVIMGAGAVGTAIARELLQRGEANVRLVSRSGSLPEGSGLPAHVAVAKGDLSDPHFAIQACKGASVVYHCAQPGYTKWPKEFPALTSAIMEGAMAVDAKLVVADNLYMYGQVDGPMKETLPNRAAGPKGRTRAAMASKLLQDHHEGKIRVAIGRAADFYGPGVLQSWMGERVFKFALQGKPVEALGNCDMPHTYTYIGDFARGLITLGQEDRALGEAWHIPSANTLATRQLLQVMFEELGAVRKVRSFSRTGVNLLALAMPIMKEFKEIMYEFEQPFIMDHSKFMAVFPEHQVTPHREAMRQTLQWYRQRFGLQHV
ncbi:NAD-dependent epimerase/dehydratase family protein [Paenibacillus sp. MMS18-CY102]|uniref:NAD-dependent epimerase/dehydratase family protein n=1 Tax=Paenibacillus sp. MMS18-CY102 TaxID=2682849 RepID=UPI0013A9B0BA|nr:NAD-dependent epimerase/dehydratase family protein [Paenibacillus sp. MMS18-CY102]MWC29706.1 NAD-dependent epimerase/dehydratase family protein [Paenibacillus sp. MMS18-CY102]